MKVFEDFQQQLLEGKVSDSIKDHLNACQHYWNQNAEQFLKQGLYPILERPFYKIKNRGVLVVGLNPGETPDDREIRDELIKGFKDNQIDPVYDRGKKEWILASPRYKGKEPPKLERGRVKGDFPDYFNSFEQLQGNKHQYKQGVFYFHSNLNRMLDDIGYADLIPKLAVANYVPFPSKDVSSIKPLGQIMKISTPWILEYIRLTRPRLIICPGGIFDNLKKYMGVTEVADPILSVASKTGKMAKYFRAGRTMEGIPVASIIHWSGSQIGGPLKATWKSEEKREQIKLQMDSLLSL